MPKEAEVLLKSKSHFEVVSAKYDLHPDIKYENIQGLPTIYTIVLKEL